MKILQVINAFYPPYISGGAAFVAHNISKALSSRGHEVTVYTTNALDRDGLFYPGLNPRNIGGAEVHYFPNLIYGPSILFHYSGELVRAIEESVSKYDVIHVHEYRSYIGLVTSYYAKKHSIPYVLQAHGQLPTIGSWRKSKWLYDVSFGYRLLRDAAKVVALSQVEAEQYGAMGVLKKKIAILSNGIDLSEYTDLPPRGCFKKKFNIPEDRKVILYLGRIHKIKGIDLLVRAYAQLTADMKPNNAVLVIAGPDDGYLGETQALIKALRINDRVLLTGPLYGKDKLQAYVDADVVVLPSRYETFPNVVLEAYACSKPVVASNVESISDIVLHGKTGFLFGPGDTQELARTISYALVHPEESVELGHKARRFVEETYSIDKVAAKLEALYEETTDRHEKT